MPDRRQMLKEINEVSFVINDLTLFLDTHPLEPTALEAFSQAMEKRKQLLKEFAKEFEPLTQDCVCPDTNNQTGSCLLYTSRCV